MDKTERNKRIKELYTSFDDIRYWIRKEIDLFELTDDELKELDAALTNVWLFLERRSS